MGKHKSGSIQVYKLTDRQHHRYRAAFSSPIKMMIMLYRTSDAEAMKSIINRTRNMQQENPKRRYDCTIHKENCQYGMTYMLIFQHETGITFVMVSWSFRAKKQLTDW